jgi:hypothetical protein
MSDNALWLNWRGVEGDERLWHSTLHRPENSPPDDSWLPAEQTAGGASASGAAGAADVRQHDARRFLAWLDGQGRLRGGQTGGGGDLDGSGGEVLPYTAAGRPGTALAGGNAFLMWRAADGALQWGVGTPGFPGAPGRWSAAGDVGGRADVAPALAVHDDTVFAAWKDAGREQIMWSRMRIGAGAWEPARALPVFDGGAFTSDVPALAGTDDGLAMAWKGVAADPHLWFSRWTPQAGRWTTPERVEPVDGAVLTTHGPGLAVLWDGPRLVWKGGPGDQRLWSARPAAGGRWTTPRIVDETINSAAGPSLTSFVVEGL